MNKLRHKTMGMLMAILSLVVVAVVSFLNISLYNREYDMLDGHVRRIEIAHEKFNEQLKPLRPFLDQRRPMFIDLCAYAVSLDEHLKVTGVTSYTDEGLTDEEVTELANDFLTKKHGFDQDYGNLYFDRYAFSLSDGLLVILDNSDINAHMQSVMWASMVLFVALELLSLLISIWLTRWLVEPVREAFEKQRQFVGDASHELKTPLSVIMASAETLERDPAQTKWAGVIHDEAEHMNTLVLSLLDLARSENDEHLEFVRTNLSNTVELAALAFESLVFEQKLKLKCEIQPDIILPCNPDKIKQLVSILLDNATKHSLKKSTITVTLTRQKNEIILRVRNRGEAIPVEEREKIFERFYRVDKARNRKEHRYGLGLAIARNIAEAHNARIAVDCLHGYTSFVVTFKLK